MTDFINEHPLLNQARARRFTPSDGGGYFSTLTEECSGDWSWKPHGHPGARARQPIPNVGRKITPMVTFTGVPPSAAELYGRMSYSPA
jgi:hypothetical protein